MPVENIVEFKRYPEYRGGSTKPSEYFNSCYEPAKEERRYPNEVEEYNAMKHSVEINHGFYVARYEAGKEEIKGIETVVSKKNAEVWNRIYWGLSTSTTEIGTEGAVARSQGMYTNKSTHNVTSTLIYGIQWDAIMSWIDPAYKTSTCAEDSVVRDSTEKGNYSGNLARCGSSDNYRIKNIYDLAGNVWEWTIESYSNSRIFRGGGYDASGLNEPTSYRTILSYPNDTERFPCCFIFITFYC